MLTENRVREFDPNGCIPTGRRPDKAAVEPSG
jgi:hypothetical protein